MGGVCTIPLNCGATGCSCTEALSHSEMTQPPLGPDAGSCKGGCDRQQLSMSNYYSKEKGDAGRSPNIDKRDRRPDTEYLNMGPWIMLLMVYMNLGIKDEE